MSYRLSFRFSPDGDRAACLTGDGALVPELWSFDADGPRACQVPTAVGETTATQPVPVPDGRVLLVRAGGRGGHVVAVAGPDDSERFVTAFDSRGLRALPSPDPATAAWLIAYHGAGQPGDGQPGTGRSVLHRVDARDLSVSEVLTVPGMVAGEGWLDPRGERLAVNHAADGGHRIVVLDLCAGTVTAAGEGTLLLASPARGELLVAAQVDGRPQLGWLTPGGSPRVLPPVDGIAGPVRPLAVDPAGTRRVVLGLTDGARSRLVVVDSDTGRVTELPVPAGVIRGAGWGRTGLHLVFSAPTQPTAVITVAVPDAAAGAVFGPAAPGVVLSGASGRSGTRLERFDGPAGPIEAVVHGPDWRASRHLLVALHGGPSAAWQLDYDPVFQAIAAAGISIVAPNQRGSTNYGAAHRDAIRGAWGGPDLDDVRQLARILAAERTDAHCRPAALYGISYGAFLALLAAAADPDAWSGCVAVAPFLSGEALYADGGRPVRALLDRLDGRTVIDDELGPRDLLRLSARITAPLMIVHGARDEIIPVAHSRRLVETLRAAGRPAERLDYREVTGADHDPLLSAEGPALVEAIVRFLVAARPVAVGS